MSFTASTALSVRASNALTSFLVGSGAEVTLANAWRSSHFAARAGLQPRWGVRRAGTCGGGSPAGAEARCDLGNADERTRRKAASLTP